jgi:acyl carrier protein phosphodiesterase
MNFLAHAYLSGDDDQVMAGNMFADFVKGKQAVREHKPLIAKGISLHRQIDAFTDTHAIVGESKKRLRPKYRHYAGVIVDVFYDHFLAKNWNTYNPLPLDQYVKRVYRNINVHLQAAPADFVYMFSYMESGNWLLNYAKIEGIARSLSGMSQRTPFESKMEQAPEDLIQHYQLFENEFTDFFPLLDQFCTQWLAEHREKF